MAGSYLPPVVQRLTADISEYLAKLEEAKAAQDDFAAHTQETNDAMKVGTTGSGGGATGSLPWVGGAAASDATKDATNLENDAFKRAATNAGFLEKQLSAIRQTITGTLPAGIQALTSNFQQLGAGIQQAAQGASQFGSGITTALGAAAGAFTGPLSLLGSLAGFAKTWAIMVPTLFAAPALLGAVGGALAGLAGSFTVASTAIGIFALGAMQAMSYVTSVSTMAQFDALSAPLQKLYYAYHNLSNEMTLMAQTAGGQNTIVSTLTNMFNTLGTVLQRIAPVMGEIASAGQSAFNVLSGGLLGPEFTKFIDWVGTEATPVLTTFSQTFVNLASGWTGMMEGLTPAITLFDNGMVRLTQTFSNWANSPKGQAQLEGFVNYVKNAWPDVSKFWGGLGHIISAFFSSAAKGAPSMAATLGHFFDTIAKGIPLLSQLADRYLPGIVKGFSAFTGGFFSGLKQGLDAIKGFGKGPDWKEMGKDAGKLAAELLKTLPAIAKIADGIVEVVTHLLKTKGAIRDIAIAWLVIQGLITAGGIITAIGGIIGMLIGVGRVIFTIGRLIFELADFFDPVTLVITAVIVALILVVTHLKQVGQIAGDIAGFFKKAINDIVSFFEKLPGRILAIVKKIPGEVNNVLKSLPGIGGLLSGGENIAGDIGKLFGGGGGSSSSSQGSANVHIRSENHLHIHADGTISRQTLDQIKEQWTQWQTQANQKLVRQMIQARQAG